uniref:hypothetical protein n=1 Tax=Porphyridium aerugineum TaxID=2792 RepID=UPI001FCDC3EA|nr:hypothetical protein MW505_pgp157 [Porphyridium aerugineum]UNJ17840.1 hypothetical protein [Porphyridium aerugineum]
MNKTELKKIILLLSLFFSFSLDSKSITLSSENFKNKEINKYQQKDLVQLNKMPKAKKNKFFSKEIYILGLYDESQIDIIKKQFKLDKLKLYGPKITLDELNALAKWMMRSKLFKNIIIKDHCLHLRKRQLIFIYLRPNEPVKYVKVINFAFHKVPYTVLNELFAKDLNSIFSPINWSKKITKVMDWYNNQGNNQIKLELKKYRSSIFLDIREKRILKVNFIEGMLADHQDSKKRQIIANKVPMPMVFEFMNLHKNAPFNIYQNYKDIEELKSKRIIDTCRCEIENINSYKNGFDLVLYITALPNKETYALYDNLVFNLPLLNGINYTLHYLKTYVYNLIYMLYEGKIDNIYNLCNLSKNTFKANNGFIFNDSNNIFEEYLYNFINLYRQFNFNMMSSLKKTYFIRHNRRHLDKNNKSVVIDFALPNINRFFELRYKDPWFKIANDSSNFLDVNYYRKFLIQDNNLLTEFLRTFKIKLLDEEYKQNSDLFTFYGDSSNIYLNLIHKLPQHQSLSNSLQSKLYLMKYIDLIDSHKLELIKSLNLLNFIDLSYIRSYNALLYSLKKLNMLVIYDKTYELDWITRGFSIKFHLINYFNHLFNTYPKDILHNKVFNKMAFDYTLYLPISKKKYSFLSTKEFMVFNFQGRKYFINLNPNIARQNSLKVLYTPNLIENEINATTRLIFNIEYHKKFKPHLSYFIVTYLNTNFLYPYNVNNMIKSKSLYLSIGLGVSINLPINNIPPIYLSYYYKVFGNGLRGIYINLRPSMNKNIIKY